MFIEFMLNMILQMIEKFDTSHSLSKIKGLTKTEREVLVF